MSSRPNVLIICTDQHRFDAISTHPGSAAITPNLAALAAGGAVFDRCYTTSPVCAPSRASMLTGRYPSSHGLWGNGVTLPDAQDLVPRQLSAEGYRCGLVGKLHLSAAFQGRTEQRVDDGFELFRWAHDPFHGSPDNAYHAWLRERVPDLWEEASGHAFTSDVEEFKHADTPFDAMPADAHYSTWVTQEVCGFLDSNPEDRPFFMVANFYDPHHPFVAPPAFVAKYPPGSLPPPVGGPHELAGKPEIQRSASVSSYVGHGPSYPDFSAEELDELRRTYYAMVTMVDEGVGSILHKLDELGLRDDTLVIFTSDHGEMLGDHAMLLKGPMMYEAAVRIPMIVRWPGQVPAGEHIDGLVGIHDVATTVREATGLPPLARDQGISLIAVASGARQPRPFALCEYRDSGYSYDPPVHTTMYRTDRYKLVVWHGEPATGAKRSGELYDLIEDPDELENLWGAPDRLGLRAELYAELVDSLVSLEDRSAPREAPW